MNSLRLQNLYILCVANSKFAQAKIDVQYHNNENGVEKKIDRELYGQLFPIELKFAQTKIW